jgi:hypothetical protein
MDCVTKLTCCLLPNRSVELLTSRCRCWLAARSPAWLRLADASEIKKRNWWGKGYESATIQGVFVRVAEVGLAPMGCRRACLRPWPDAGPGQPRPKGTPQPGWGETRLGFVSPELGCARRTGGDFGAAAGGSRGLARERENSSAPFPPRGNGDPPANHRGYKVRVAPRFGSSSSCSLHLPLPS